MNDHGVWVFLHVMLLVYWLGADLGVLLLARAAKRPDLSFAERTFALQMSARIDLVPRLCFTVMFPVGLHVADSGGWLQVPSWAFALSWTTSAGWIALLLAIGRNEGTPLGASLNRAHLVFQGMVGLLLGYVAVQSLLGHGPLPGGWFAAKVLLFAVIFAMGIGIDYAFRPAAPAFLRLAAEGSKPDIEATISRAVDVAIRYVLCLYALLAVIAFLGITKPF